MTKTQTRNTRRPAKRTGPQIIRTVEVILFPILDGEPHPELAHEPMLVRLAYTPGQEPADRDGLKAKGEALTRAIRLERRSHGSKAGVDFDASSIVVKREQFRS